MAFYKKAFKDIRIAKGFTQGDIAKRMNVSVQAVSNWENEHKENPREHKIYRLAAILGCKPDDISDCTTLSEIYHNMDKATEHPQFDSFIKDLLFDIWNSEKLTIEEKNKFSSIVSDRFKCKYKFN